MKLAKHLGLVLVSGFLLQACVSSFHGVSGNLFPASGMEFELPDDEFFVVRNKEGRSDAMVVAFPAGTYVLEAIDDRHAYFVAPKYAIVWDVGGLANDYENGETILYEDFYQGRLAVDDYALYKPGCRPGGIKIPFVDTVPAKYDTYFYYCPKGTWDVENVDASRIPDPAEEVADPVLVSAAQALGAAAMDKAQSGKLIIGYPFPEGSEGFDFLFSQMPPVSRSEFMSIIEGARQEAPGR